MHQVHDAGGQFVSHSLHPYEPRAGNVPGALDRMSRRDQGIFGAVEHQGRDRDPGEFLQSRAGGENGRKLVRLGQGIEALAVEDGGGHCLPLEVFIERETASCKGPGRADAELDRLGRHGQIVREPGDQLPVDLPEPFHID